MDKIMEFLPFLIPLVIAEFALLGYTLHHILTHKNYKRGNSEPLFHTSGKTFDSMFFIAKPNKFQKLIASAFDFNSAHSGDLTAKREIFRCCHKWIEFRYIG